MFNPSGTITPFLSILIPAYKYPQGVTKILNMLNCLPDDVEVLVFDDTPNDDLKDIVKAFVKKMPGLYYRHNPSFFGKSLGAAYNWNSLLDEARGEYVLLMHHDELPLSRDFVAELRSVISGHESVDVFMLDLILIDDETHEIKRHLPYWLRWSIMTNASGYLFRRNVIGPTASIIVRCSKAPRFDTRLRWFVDVEYYVRLFRQGLRYKGLKMIGVKSVQRNVGSITCDLASDLSEIKSLERKYLIDRYPENKVWLGVAYGAPVRGIEFIVWGLFKMVYAMYSKIQLKIVSKIDNC